jgi:hypothetical protein
MSYRGPMRMSVEKRRLGEKHEFTKRREHSRAKAKAARQARKRQRS